MTKQQFEIAKDLLEQIKKIDSTKEKIKKAYHGINDKGFQELLEECDSICSALKGVKEGKFSQL